MFTSESTNEHDEEFYHLFVPTTPNPTSGFFIIIPKEDTTLADLNVEEGFRMIVSSGMVGSHKNSIVNKKRSIEMLLFLIKPNKIKVY